jgi:hypothetical protein
VVTEQSGLAKRALPCAINSQHVLFLPTMDGHAARSAICTRRLLVVFLVLPVLRIRVRPNAQFDRRFVSHRPYLLTAIRPTRIVLITVFITARLKATFGHGMKIVPWHSSTQIRTA